MLTPKNIKAKTAIEYFKQGYYQKGKWLGKGALMLGLKGEIKNHQVYENIVQGLSPDGNKRLNKRVVHSDKRKAAVDCTFAAPKSVSLCAFIGGDERLIQAHIRVVEKVLEEMESRYASTRIMHDGGKQEVVLTGNMVIAKYDHIESRELDPHLHSHCLVMNMTQLPNGEWYSHLNDEIFRNQKLLGMIYQHYLAIEVQKLGYEIELLEHGQFDIKGYSTEALIDFSKRRVQILAQAPVNASSDDREKAWSKTRRNKENVAPEELLARWLKEANSLGIEIVRPGAPKLEPISNQVDEKIFVDAIKYCSERQVAFRAEDIQAFILAESQPLDIASVEPLINSSDELIRIQEQNGIRYTTIAAVERELATINLMKAGQGKVGAIAQREIVKAHLTQTELNLGQRQAVMMTLTTTDRFIAWQGVAGAGKTFALKEVLSLAQKHGYSVKGFAPSSKASNVLGQELETQTQTVARLLASKPPNEIEPNQIWIVDEAGLLGAKDAYRLFQRATSEQARVILVGDTKQLSAVEAGNPFKSLQQAGIETAYLNESQRQKDSPQLKLAIDLLASGRVEAGFAQLSRIGCIQKVDKGNKTEEIVKAYFKATAEVQAKTLILAGTHKERIELTAALRAELQDQGRLGSDVKLTQLKSKDLREVQLGYTSHFAVGDMVMSLRDYKRRGLAKGELYEVVGTTSDTIKVKTVDGRQLEVDLNFKKAVFEPEQIEIAVGDCLMWKKNNHQKQQVNGHEVKVLAINGSTVHVQEQNGKEHTLDLNQPHHLDHAIVRTTYSSQGSTADRVLIAADFTIGKESFYVAASRARMELCFFTSDQTKLLEWATSSRAQENPLEIIKNSFSEQISVEQLVGFGQSKTTPQTASQTPPQPIKHTTASPAPKPSQKSTTPPAAALAFPPKFPIPNPVKRTQPKHEQTQNQQITPPIPHPVRKPIQSEPFWTPTRAGVAPSHFEQKHWHELVEGSAINPLLASRNVRSLGMDSIEQWHEAWEYLMYSDRLERTNTGRLSSGILKHYQHIEHGGWWASAGIDARSLPNLNPGEKPKLKLWGCFKPDYPRVDNDKSQKKGKTEYIKYEHPLKEERQLFLFDVPDALAQRIYDKYGINPTEAEKQSGFWYITYKYNLPITVAEGAKKTLSSLSQGEITIGVSGVNGGYYANDPEKNRLMERVLHPELKVFATPGREFRFAFDQDTKQSTVWNVRRDLVRTGELLEQEGCSVRVVHWEADRGKGLDDLIVNQSPLAYIQSVSNSIPLNWEANKHYRGEYIRLSNKVRASLPTLSSEAIDVEVYKLARFKGDIRDGARTIAQSDQVRTFKAMMPTDEAREKTFSYIGQIEKLISVHSRQLKSEQQQPVHQSNEAYYDINTQSFQPERKVTTDKSNERNRLVDRRTNGVESKQHQTDGENRLTREQPKSIEGGSDLSANQPEPNPQRVDAQMGQLLAATNQYAQRQEAERTSANLEGFYHSSTERKLSSRGAKELTNANGQQNAAILDSPRTDARIDPQITKLEITRQCLNAIAEYIEQLFIETARSENLPALTQKLNQLTHKPIQRALSCESLQTQAVDAIAEYISQQSIEATLIETLPAFTQKLNQITHKLPQTEQLDESLPRQAIDAIAEYIEQQTIEVAIIENLPAFTQQLNQLVRQDFEQTTQLDKPLQAGAIDALAKLNEVIAQYIEQLFIKSALLENLPDLTHKLNQLTKYKAGQFEQLDRALPMQAIDAITEYIEQHSVEAAIIKNLPTLTQTLNQLTQKFGQSERLDESLPIQAIDAIADYIEWQSIEAALNETLPAFTQQLNQPSKQPTQTAQLNEFLQTQAVDAIAQHIEWQSIESVIIEKLPAFTQKLNQLRQKFDQTQRLDECLPQQAVNAIAEYIERQSIEAAIIENLPAFTQKLNQLGKHKYRQSEQIDESLQVQAVQSLASAIADYQEQVTINQVITPDFQKLIQLLVEVSDSRLTEQLHQVEQAIEPQRKPLVSQQTTAQLPPQVFMGSQPQPDKLQPIQNHGAVYKPIGGLWTSPYQSQYGSEWAVFVQKEGMNVPPHKQQLWLVVPKPDLKILVVDSPEKLKSLPHLPPRIKDDDVCPINYEAIAKQYDALVIKPQLLLGCMEVASFDVESTIWFGSQGYPFVHVEPLKLPLVDRQVSQPTVDSAIDRVLSIDSKSLEQPIARESQNLKNLDRWKCVAVALGKPVDYINRIATTRSAIETGASLPRNTAVAMQQDFQAYQQTSDAIEQWYDAAKALGKSDQYLSEIQQVARAFHNASVPSPLSALALGTMQQDLDKHEQQQMQCLWQHYSLAVEPVRPMMKANAIALAAIKDGHSAELIHKILKHDPHCIEIRQRSGEQVLQKHILVSVQNALYNGSQQNQPHQVNQQHQHKQKPGFEL